MQEVDGYVVDEVVGHPELAHCVHLPLRLLVLLVSHVSQFLDRSLGVFYDQFPADTVNVTVRVSGVYQHRVDNVC